MDENSLPIALELLEPLTKVEVKLLTAIADPDVRYLMVKDVCKAAGISLDSYYRAFRKPHFIAAHNIMLIALIKMQAEPLIKTAIEHAKKGSYQHWKALMEMGGYYSDRMMVGDGSNGEIVIRFADPRKAIDVTPEAPKGEIDQ